MTILHVETIGTQGPALLLLHGWGQTCESFRPLAELLASFGQAHLIDLPGFGSSPAPESDWDTIQYAERIYQYIQENGLNNVILIGHSFGGRISIRLSSKYPEVVKGLILINSGGLRRITTAKMKLRSSAVKALGKFCRALDTTMALTLYQDFFIPRFASVDYKNAGRLRGILVKSVNEELSSDAKKITAPTYIIWGEQDQETPLEMGQRYHSLIQQSQLLVLPGKGHFPFTGDGAHLCAKYIYQFLRSLGIKPIYEQQEEKAPRRTGVLNR